jgi:drug/metabolite transporter (DMT)-like permease
VLLIGTTVLWGLSFPLLRGLQLAQHEAAPDVPESLLACANMAMRFGVAAILLLPFYGWNLFRVTGREWSQATGLALFASVGLYLQTLGLARTDASVSAFLTQLYTLIVPLIVAVRDRRLPSHRVIAACALVLVGAAMLSPGFMTHLTLGAGELVILLSSIFLAGQIVWVERPVYAENRAGLVTLIMFVMMAAVFGAGFLATGGTPPMVKRLFGTPALEELALALVLFCTAFNFLIMNAWQRRITATEAGLIYCIEPVIATVLSSFLPGLISGLAGVSYPNEALPWTLLAGGVLIVTATVLVATERRP